MMNDNDDDRVIRTIIKQSDSNVANKWSGDELGEVLKREYFSAGCPSGTLGKYEAIRVLGEGALAKVFLVRDPHLQRLAAIKVQVPHAKSEFARFLKEAQTLAKIDHVNVVKVYEINPTSSPNYLVMEYIEGVTLREIINSNNFSIKDKINLIIQICEGLNAIHQKGFIHRDIKPENIMLNVQNQIKIMDFNIVRDLDSNLTGTRELLGTPAYCSPEQLRTEALDSRTDIFSLGVVAYELLTGKQPFQANNIADLALKITQVEPQHPKMLMATIPDKVCDVVMGCLVKDRSQRTPTASQVARELKVFSNETIVPSIASAAAKSHGQTKPRKNRFWLIFYPLASVVLVLVGWRGWHLKTNSLKATNIIEEHRDWWYNAIHHKKIIITASDNRDVVFGYSNSPQKECEEKEICSHAVWFLSSPSESQHVRNEQSNFPFVAALPQPGANLSIGAPLSRGISRHLSFAVTFQPSRQSRNTSVEISIIAHLPNERLLLQEFMLPSEIKKVVDLAIDDGLPDTTPIHIHMGVVDEGFNLVILENVHFAYTPTQ